LEEGLQREGLEEPGGVSKVPLGRTCVVIRLDDLVLVAQGPRQLRGKTARSAQAIMEGLSGAVLNVFNEDSITRAHNPSPFGNAFHIRPQGQASSSHGPVLNTRFSSFVPKIADCSALKPEIGTRLAP